MGGAATVVVRLFATARCSPVFIRYVVLLVLRVTFFFFLLGFAGLRVSAARDGEAVGAGACSFRTCRSITREIYKILRPSEAS